MARADQVINTPHLLLSEYESRAGATNKLMGNAESKDQLRFGLFGEIGGLLALVKKQHRDLAPADHHAITEELGDALWYLSNVGVEYRSHLLDVGAAAMAELQRRLGVNRDHAGELTFEEFDGLLTFSHAKLSEGQIPSLLRQLATHVGQAMSSGPDDKDLLSKPAEELLGQLFADLAMVAALFRQRLADVARSNLRKIASRWPGDNPVYLELFDEGRSLLERFPRRFYMQFIERVPAGGGRPYVIQRLGEVNIGDRLTDNRTEQDGYRFHDVFHLAYLVHLGWSPVIRALLKLKRKSDPELDENEDGARAIIIEEGIATWIFNHAHRRNFFRDIEVGRLDYGMLKQVLDMVDGYEAARCPLWQWERAILDGFKVFRELAEAGNGIVHIDLEKRTLTFEAAPPGEEPQPAQQPRPALVGALPPN